MPNAIKYSTSAQTLALKDGNYWIGTGDVDKGPTSTTDYWNGITPPSGGYTIYLNKASNGPSIYTAANDSALISLTNSIANASYTTVAQCFNYFRSQNDKMVFNRDYEPIVTNGLVLCLDAGFRPSYTTSGTTWYDISSSGNNGTLINGTSYSSSNGGVISFDGTDDSVNISNSSSLQLTTQMSLCAWINLNSSSDSIADIFNKQLYVNESNNSGYILRYFNGAFGAFGQMSFVLMNDLYTSVYTNTNVVLLNTWYYISATYNGSVMIIYVNGVSQAALNYSSNAKNNTEQLTISVPYSGFSSLGGNVAIAQIYNRALSSTEVLQNFNAQKARFGL